MDKEEADRLMAEHKLHKATPTVGGAELSEAVRDRLSRVCAICGKDIKAVPGGQGTTHIHVDTQMRVGDTP